jgi:phosphohistidine phosphatase
MPPTRRILWLLRHAKTVADPPPGGTDFDRPLAPRGRRDATALGHLLSPDAAGLGLKKVRLPQVALVSPAARTAATAELVLADLTEPPRSELVAGLYEADPNDVLDQLRGLDDDVTSAMVVGHNPTAHALAQGLLSDADKHGRHLVQRRGFPTCALGIYSFHLDHWTDVDGRQGHLEGLFIPPFEPS